ncbi:MAG: hypothetical protein WCL02_08205 [bacterium]
MEFGNSPERKFCVPVSVRSRPVENIILPSSLLPDIFAKYNPEKLETLLLFTVEKLLIIPCEVSVLPIAVYIDDQFGQSIPHKAINVLYTFTLFPLTVLPTNEAKLSPLPRITDLIA